MLRTDDEPVTMRQRAGGKCILKVDRAMSRLPLRSWQETESRIEVSGKIPLLELRQGTQRLRGHPLAAQHQQTQ